MAKCLSFTSTNPKLGGMAVKGYKDGGIVRKPYVPSEDRAEAIRKPYIPSEGKAEIIRGPYKIKPDSAMAKKLLEQDKD
jgi:hypothetical protein